MTACVAGIPFDRHSGESRNPVPLFLVADVPVFFRAHPARAGGFLLRGQENVTKEKATPAPRFSAIHGRKVRSARPGLAHAPSVARGPSERNPLRSPCGPDRPHLTVAQGPRWRAFLRDVRVPEFQA